MPASDKPDKTHDKPGGKRRRRVVLPPPEGTDLHPESEPERFTDDDNSERLHNDKPPHWG